MGSFLSLCGASIPLPPLVLLSTDGRWLNLGMRLCPPATNLPRRATWKSSRDVCVPVNASFCSKDILVKAREEMRRRATHDGLTHPLNRISVAHRLEDALERVRRYEAEFGVVLCEVDHFKSISGTDGHPVGDDILHELAKRLERAVRAGDAVGRFAGEEFLLVRQAVLPTDWAVCIWLGGASQRGAGSDGDRHRVPSLEL